MKEEGASASTLRFNPSQFAALLASVDRGEVSANAAKEVFAEMFRTGKEPARIISEKGLGQVSDVGLTEGIVDQVIGQSPSEVEKYRSGKKQVFGFLVGQVMKAMKGKGNPALINELLKKKLG
jgi:aspartyl-tRNA(Asn)/glutamyl-tRNA(Gln) amidotransferase subunit B